MHYYLHKMLYGHSYYGRYGRGRGGGMYLSHLIPDQYRSYCYFIQKKIVNYDDASTSGESSICIAVWDLDFGSDRKPGSRLLFIK